ncbi:MAG: hypothetical protein LBC10_05020 [Deltaproteobacteria bacterium]|nr:hypothetical protein [Deltaproteobacteria bacterium]
MNVWMRIAAWAAALWLLFPACVPAQEAESRLVLRDEAAGYALLLPADWQEVTDADLLDDLVRRIGGMFLQHGRIPGAAYMRGALLPDSAPASPALIVFTLGYEAFGLGAKNVLDIADDSKIIARGLANVLQTSYLQHYPNSIMIDNYLGDDFFSLNLRSVLDFADEAGTTRNRYIKVALVASGVVILMAQYDGPPDPQRDPTIAACVREMIIVPEKTLQSVKPPYQASFLDYVLFVGAALVVFVVVRRMRGR